MLQKQKILLQPIPTLSDRKKEKPEKRKEKVSFRTKLQKILLTSFSKIQKLFLSFF